MKSPLQFWREWRCVTRYWYPKGVQLRKGDTVIDRQCAANEVYQYWPCVVCRVPRYYHEPNDHPYVETAGLAKWCARAERERKVPEWIRSVLPQVPRP